MTEQALEIRSLEQKPESSEKPLTIEDLKSCLSKETLHTALNNLFEQATQFKEGVISGAKSIGHETKNFRKHPKETIAALVGVCASLAATQVGGGNTAELEALRELQDAYQRGGIVEGMTLDLPSVETTTFDGLRDTATETTVPLDISTTAEMEETPDTNPEKNMDYVFPVPFNTEQVPDAPEGRHENPEETKVFSLYTVKEGDTLSDIINEQVYKGQAPIYQTTAEGQAMFSDEFIEASYEILVKNLTEGTFALREVSPFGIPVGLDTAYLQESQEVYEGHAVESTVRALEVLLSNNPGDSEGIKDILDNTPKELLPHILRHLGLPTELYLPVLQQSESKDGIPSNRSPLGEFQSPDSTKDK